MGDRREDRRERVRKQETAKGEQGRDIKKEREREKKKQSNEERKTDNINYVLKPGDKQNKLQK